MNNRATLATIGEIIQVQQPDVFKALAFKHSFFTGPTAERDVTEWVTSAAWLTDHQRRIARIMVVPPRPGRGAQ